jgi:sphingomyelin phosphodiesterase
VNTPSQALADQFDWNYGYVSKLWEYEGWINHLVGNSARKHYGAYSVRRKGGLRIISLNTDLCELGFS